MRLGSIWNDIYGSTLALYQGRAGGGRWLATCAPALAPLVLEPLAELDGKGSVLLLIQDGAFPLHAALQEQHNPALGRGLSGVLVLDRELWGGPALEVPAGSVMVAASGLSYREGGSFPAWQDALHPRRQPQDQCIQASVCAELGLPVRVCAPERLGETLREWWAASGAVWAGRGDSECR
ncbi:hypothetical protein [Deinococcus sp.]|uniref:hypothetical protein n=1 Tax=Deinococcus sp. TaxID=47478 RepID=UPI003CC56E64